jgi:hypothetical protein
MIISNVNIGSGPGANDGESIYSAFYKVNQNFANVRSNINSLTNSVSSVAGRTGNVTLTINDIVGLSTSYASQANIVTANLGMKGYVDSVASQSIYGNANVASYLSTHTGNIAGGNLTIAGNIISRKANITGETNTGINAIFAGIPGVNSFGQSIASFHGNINDSMLVTAHNKNTGNLSSVAFVAVADDGDADYNNISMGVASSTWTPGLFGLYAHDGELAVAGGNLVISAGVNINRDLIFTASSNFETARFQVSSPTSANLKLGSNVGLKFADNTVQITAWTGAYTANSASSWNGAAPTTIASALDRLAILLKSLNSGTGA